MEKGSRVKPRTQDDGFFGQLSTAGREAGDPDSGIPAAVCLLLTPSLTLQLVSWRDCKLLGRFGVL